MERKPIELAPGAIWPTQHGPWGSAIDKLHEAAAACNEMEGAKDRVTYQRGWTRLVESLQEFWVNFSDEGKKKFSPFQPWAGAENAKRQSDGALRYLIEARHQSEHGGHPLNWEEPRVQLGPNFNGTVQRTAIYQDGTFEAQTFPSPGSNEFKMVLGGGAPRLPSIYNKKSGKTFPPPTHHLGKALNDSSPLAVGQLAVTYYDALLKSAFDKFMRG